MKMTADGNNGLCEWRRPGGRTQQRGAGEHSRGRRSPCGAPLCSTLLPCFPRRWDVRLVVRGHPAPASKDVQAQAAVPLPPVPVLTSAVARSRLIQHRIGRRSPAPSNLLILCQEGPCLQFELNS